MKIFNGKIWKFINVYISALGNFSLNISFGRTVDSRWSEKLWRPFIPIDSPENPDFDIFDVTVTAAKLSNFVIYERWAWYVEENDGFIMTHQWWVIMLHNHASKMTHRNDCCCILDSTWTSFANFLESTFFWCLKYIIIFVSYQGYLE